MSPTVKPKRRRRITAIVLTTLFVAVSALGVSTAANAVYMLGGMNSANYSVKNPGYNSTWMNPINAARTNWNNSCDPCNITWSTGATATIVSVNLPTATWNGRYTPSWGTSFKIELNSPKISLTPPFATSLRSTTAHEFGHSFSLGDYRTGNGTKSLMAYERNRMVIYGPTTMDINEVEDYYP